MKKTNVITILFLLLFSTAYSQLKFELGKVSIAELAEKFNPSDSSDVAVILYNRGKTHFEYNQEEGFTIVTEVETRVKIYKKEGYEWANVAVPFYVGGNSKESVSISKAFTYNLIDGKIEKTKLKSESEFIEKTNKYYSQKKIVLPNVKEGSVIEYMYVVKSPYVTNFPTWEFQKNIPVSHSEYTVHIPEYFTYNPILKGGFSPVIKNEKFNETITLLSKERVGVYITTVNRSTEDVYYTANQTNYVLDNIPALKEESFVNNINIGIGV